MAKSELNDWSKAEYKRADLGEQFNTPAFARNPSMTTLLEKLRRK